MRWHFLGFPHALEDTQDDQAIVERTPSLHSLARALHQTIDAPNDRHAGNVDRAFHRAFTLTNQAYFQEERFSDRQMIRLYYLTAMLASSIHEWETALEHLEFCAQLIAQAVDPRVRDPHVMALLHYQTGVIAFHSHHYRSALVHFQALLDLEQQLLATDLAQFIEEEEESFFCDVHLERSKAQFAIGNIRRARVDSRASLVALSQWIQHYRQAHDSLATIPKGKLFLATGHLPETIFQQLPMAQWKRLSFEAPWEHARHVMWHAKLDSGFSAPDLRVHGYEVLAQAIQNLSKHPEEAQRWAHHLYLTAAEIAFTGFDLTKAETQRDWLLLAHEDIEMAELRLQENEPQNEQHHQSLRLAKLEWNARNKNLLGRTSNMQPVIDAIVRLQKLAADQHLDHIVGHSSRVLGNIHRASNNVEHARLHYDQAHAIWDQIREEETFSPYHAEIIQSLQRLTMSR